MCGGFGLLVRVGGPFEFWPCLFRSPGNTSKTRWCPGLFVTLLIRNHRKRSWDGEPTSITSEAAEDQTERSEKIPILITGSNSPSPAPTIRLKNNSNLPSSRIYLSVGKPFQDEVTLPETHTPRHLFEWQVLNLSQTYPPRDSRYPIEPL